MTGRKFFGAYPGSATPVRDCFRAASQKLESYGINFQIWEQNDVCGLPLTDPIFGHIESSDAVVADVTRLNFNVTFEIGYAIGCPKRVILVKNVGLISDETLFAKIGIFDTLGYISYENSDELRDIIRNSGNLNPLTFDQEPDKQAPLYLVELPISTDFMRILTSRIKKSRLRYRSFNEQEHARLSARDAIDHVGRSLGVVVPIASVTLPEANIHNTRAAFVAGLSLGMNIPLLVLQEYGGPVPADVRDLAKTVKHHRDIATHIHNLGLQVVDGMQDNVSHPSGSGKLLSTLSLGDPMAENEFSTLGGYYLQTDQFKRALRGEVNVVVGRKATGKTALFSQLRDRKRKDKINIICDLKPEGYQLVRLKEEILAYLNEGSREHLITAFWEYILYLEIIYKILEKDENRYLGDHKIRERYIELRDLYNNEGHSEEGDFSERLMRVSDRLAEQFKSQSLETTGTLTNNQITNLLYRHDLRNIRALLTSYLLQKGEVWILFDNLDKGWPPGGLQSVDVMMLRCLIDAARKIQRELQKSEVDMHGVVFIRNDVFQLLMKNSADFGKEMRVSLDWSDPDQLKEMLRRRLTYSAFDSDTEFLTAWRTIAIALHEGEDSFEFLIRRSLMRPRNIIKLVMHCKAAAVNLDKDKIDGEDIEKGILAYSHDLLLEADRELADIDPKLSSFLYTLIGEKSIMGTLELWELLEKHGVAIESWDRAVDYLIYFGFFGLSFDDGEEKYIFDYNYNMDLLKAQQSKRAQDHRYSINPAFWPALDIEPQ